MGATLEQFDLSQEDYGGLLGQMPRGAGPQPPRRDRGRPRLDARGRRRGGRDRHLPGLAAEARRVGARRADARDQHQGGRRSPARRPARSASSPARSGRPASCPPPTTRPSATSPSRKLVEVFAEQARGLVEGGADLIIIETAQDILEVKAAIFGAREAFAATGRTLPIQTSVSLLPSGGKMLLGTDIEAVLTTLAALEVDVIGLNCSTGPEDMRDAIRFLGENSPAAGPLHPQRRPAAAGARRRDDLPRRARAAGGDARRVRRALRRRHRRRLLRDDARSTSPRSASGSAAACPASAPRRARSRSPR